MSAIDSWLNAIKGAHVGAHVSTLLRTETPPLLSWIVRGGCAVQCEHCIFPYEGPKAIAQETRGDWLLALLRQLGQGTILVHEGRQLLPWQVPVLRKAVNAGFGVSLINNGQYTTPAMLNLCEREGLQIDTLDVSIDGPTAVHNLQRASEKAWTWAMRGIEHAPRILKPTGKLTSLMTLTSLNCDVVSETGVIVTPMVDEWHLTTMSLRPGLESLRAERHHLERALTQLLGQKWDKPVYLRTYSLQDFVDLLTILGPKTAREALENAMVIYNAIVLDIGGIPLYFYPKSLQVNETLVVDADQWWRLPFCIHHTLPELQAGVDINGNNISHYNVERVSETTNVAARFGLATDMWWGAIGEQCFAEEQAKLQPIFNT